MSASDPGLPPLSCVTLSLADNGVLTISMARPKQLNALNGRLISDLRRAFAIASNDDSVRCIIFTGEGPGFCAGADLVSPPHKEFEGSPRPKNLSFGGNMGHDLLLRFNPLITEIYACRKPIVTAINGVAAGGGLGLALCGDITIAADTASFRCVFLPQLGLAPDMGSTWFLARNLGRSRAFRLAFTGEKLSAKKAYEWGLISDVVPKRNLLERARSTAATLAAGPTNAFVSVRWLMDAAHTSSLQDQLEKERRLQCRLGDRPEFVEGVRAFMQKRKPNFAIAQKKAESKL